MVFNIEHLQYNILSPVNTGIFSAPEDDIDKMILLTQSFVKLF